MTPNLTALETSFIQGVRERQQCYHYIGTNMDLYLCLILCPSARAHACVGDTPGIQKASHDKLNLVSSHQKLHLTQPLLNQQMSPCEDVEKSESTRLV